MIIYSTHVIAGGTIESTFRFEIKTFRLTMNDYYYYQPAHVCQRRRTHIYYFFFFIKYYSYEYVRTSYAHKMVFTLACCNDVVRVAFSRLRRYNNYIMVTLLRSDRIRRRRVPLTEFVRNSQVRYILLLLLLLRYIHFFIFIFFALIWIIKHHKTVTQ